MKYLKFDGDTPVTGITFLDKVIRDNGFEYDRSGKIVVKFIHNNNEFIARLCMLEIYITSINRNFHHFGYGESELFHYFINNITHNEFTVDGIDCNYSLHKGILAIHLESDDGCIYFPTYAYIGMPIDEFITKSRTVLESLIDKNIKFDLKYTSELTDAYNAAMK